MRYFCCTKLVISGHDRFSCCVPLAHADSRRSVLLLFTSPPRHERSCLLRLWIIVRRENRHQRNEVLMCELTLEQVRQIQQALSEDKRKEVVVKVENGKIVILCVHKKRIG